jgi:glycerol-3-phosphate acyltransferase PlsY
MAAAAGYVIFVFMLEPVFGQPSSLSHQIFAIIIASAVIIKHKTNIKRLMNGNENRISSFKPAKGRLNKEEEQEKS